jgi:hypothetical protein
LDTQSDLPNEFEIGIFIQRKRNKSNAMEGKAIDDLLMYEKGRQIKEASKSFVSFCFKDKNDLRTL